MIKMICFKVKQTPQTKPNELLIALVRKHLLISWSFAMYTYICCACFRKMTQKFPSKLKFCNFITLSCSSLKYIQVNLFVNQIHCLQDNYNQQCKSQKWFHEWNSWVYMSISVLIKKYLHIILLLVLYVGVCVLAYYWIFLYGLFTIME